MFWLSEDIETDIGFLVQEDQGNLCVSGLPSVKAPAYVSLDDVYAKWQEDALKLLGLKPSEFVYESEQLSEPAQKRFKVNFPVCTVAVEAPQVLLEGRRSTPALADFSKTREAVLLMCQSLKASVTDEQRAQLVQLCEEYSCIWNAGDKPLATTNLTKFSVELLTGATAVADRPRRVPILKHRLIAAAVQKGLDAGIYEASESAWAAPVVLVPREDPTDDRLCADYRKLKERTRVPKYPLLS